MTRVRLPVAVSIAALILIAAGAARADDEMTPIDQRSLAPVTVVLHSYHVGFGRTDNISTGIREYFARHAESVELWFEFLDARRISSEEYLESFARMLEAKYADRKVDAVICCDDQALLFLLGPGRGLFQAVPVVFCSVSSFDESMRGVRPLTGLVENLAIAETMETALALHPRTEEVVVITDMTRTGRALRAKAETAFKTHRNRVRFTYLEDLTMEELERETAALGEGSLVFLFVFARDRTGQVFSHEETLRRIRRVCDVPIYGLWEFYLGQGIVGGKLTSGRDEGRLVAEMACRIIDGDDVSEIPLGRSPTRFMFDWRELERFGVDVRALPADSVIVERPYSVVRQHPTMFLAIGATIAVLLTLVAFLVFNTLRRHRAEAVLARFADILESTSDFVATATPFGEVTFVNSAGRRLIGWDEDEPLEGKRIRDVQPKWVLRLIREVATPILAEEGAWSGESAVIHRNGDEIPVSQVILAHRSKGGEIDFYSTVIRDLRPRIETENALRVIEEQLEHSRKMEAIGQLAGGVAHDFNNLLTGIMGNADLLTSLLPEGSREAQRAQEIVTASEKAAALTRQLLTFSRKGSFKTQMVDLVEVVDGVINLLSRSIDRRIEIERRCTGERAAVMGDASQIENAILNLAVNARDAMPDGGVLGFSVGIVNVETDSVDVRSEQLEPGEYVEILVSDTGIGISAALQDKIFEPFFTTKGQGEGTGLGLATAYGCVRNHNGMISVASEVEKGSAFRVLLPRADGEPVDERESTVVGGLPTGKAHVLLVDDEDVVRDLVTEGLSSIGYSVTACTNGLEALEFFRRESRSVDVVILDLIMPKMSGADTFQALKEIDPQVKVLLSSGFTAGAGSQELIEQGAVGFLVKPFTISEVAEELRRVTGDG